MIIIIISRKRQEGVLTIGVPGRQQTQVRGVSRTPAGLVRVVAGTVEGTVPGGGAGGGGQGRGAGVGQYRHHGVVLGQHQRHLAHRQVVSVGGKVLC